MIRNVIAATIVWPIGCGLVFATGYAAGQRHAPSETVGQSAVELRSLDLSNELDSTKGRSLRMRKVTLQPGGVLMHPAPRRCSSVVYSRYVPSSRLAGRTPRRPRCVTVFMKGST